MLPAHVRGCAEGIQRVYRGCTEGVQRVYRGCAEDAPSVALR